MGSGRCNTFDSAADWLLKSADPSVRYLALTEVLGRPAGSRDARAARAALLEGPRVRALLAGQQADGGFGVHPYHKWSGAHWRLVSLVELGIPAGEPRACAAAEQVLGWLANEKYRQNIPRIQGRTRQHASMEGNAVAACCRLGLAEDERVRVLARSLIDAQWPDGGWNCDKRPGAGHSSFYESLAPMWGLIEYANATGDRASRRAAKRAAEFFLQHRLFLSDRTGKVINPEWLKLHYPLYWHYDILQALLILSRLGPLKDARARPALEALEAKRRPDGTWRSGGRYWKRVVKTGEVKPQLYDEVVDWGRSGPNEMITLNALRVLRAAGRQVS
jgi:hypothetical protein